MFNSLAIRIEKRSETQKSHSNFMFINYGKEVQRLDKRPDGTIFNSEYTSYKNGIKYTHGITFKKEWNMTFEDISCE